MRTAIVGLASLVVVGLALGQVAPGATVSSTAPSHVMVVTSSARTGGSSAFMCGHLSVCGNK